MADEKKKEKPGVITPEAAPPKKAEPETTDLAAENAALAEANRKLGVQLSMLQGQLQSYKKAVERYASAQLALCETVADLRSRLHAQ